MWPFSLLSKSIPGGSRNPSELSWRGPFSLFGEFGNKYQVGCLEDNWQRFLTPAGRERNIIIAAIRNAYGYSLSSSGMEHIRKEKDGGITVLDNTAAFRCLRYPNPYQTQIDLVMLWVSSLIYYGNAYGYAKRNDRYEIVEIIPLPPHQSRAVLAEDGTLYYDVSWEWDFFKTGNVQSLVPARDVVHIKLATHRSLLFGESPIADAGFSIGLNNAITQTTGAFQANMNRPSGILSTDLTLTKAQMTELRAAFEEQSQGMNQGRVPILGGGMKWSPMGVKATDAQVLETYKMTVQDLCRLFRIPPQLLGLDTTGNATSTETLISQWRATGLLFYAEVIERALERFFNLPKDEEIRFDLNNLARANFVDLISALAVSVQNGMHSPNEARNEVGLPSVPFGDSPRVQAQNVRLEDAKPAPVAPSAGKDKAPSNQSDDNDALDDETAKALAIAMITKAMTHD
jgi:HK97 family phage portal protein